MADIKTVNLNGISYTIVDSTAVHTVDTVLSTSSTNPVRNSVVTQEINKKPTLIRLAKKFFTSSAGLYVSTLPSSEAQSISSQHDGVTFMLDDYDEFYPSGVIYALLTTSVTSAINGVDYYIYSGTTARSDFTSKTFSLAIPYGSSGGTIYLKEGECDGGGVAPVEDTDVFLSRAVNFGENKYKFPSLVGGTVAWNQLVASLRDSSTVYGLTFTNNFPEITITGICTTTANYTIVGQISFIENHIYIGFAGTNCTLGYGLIVDGKQPPIGSDGVVYKKGASNFAFNLRVASGSEVNLSLKPMVIDLTLALGPTIADYIYSLEQATTGAGVNWFKQYFPKSYYPYNAGALISVNPTGAGTVGVNQWDEEWEEGAYNPDGSKTTQSDRIRSKNPIPVIPNTAYYLKVPSISSIVFVVYLDNNGDGIETSIRTYAPNTVITTPANAAYMVFYLAAAYGTTYNHDICINISNSLYNGTYYPYTSHSYSISPVELRGSLKLSDGKLTYDGDVRASDGTVTRKYGLVDLGTLSFYSYGVTDTFDRYVSTDLDSLSITNAQCISARFTNKRLGEDVSANMVWIGGGIAKLSITTTKNTYSDADAFKTAMSGVYLVYELATPTTESSEALPVPQVVYDGGTESYIDERDVQIPVGQDATYMDATSAIGELMDSGLVPSGSTYIFDGTYDASTNKAATVSTVTNAINNLNAAVSGLGAGKTITALSETNGVISASASNISIAASQVSSGTLATARMPTGYMQEAYLGWGGKNYSASFGPMDAAMINVLGADRFAFLPAACVTIEYSTDAGATWTDYGATDAQKISLFAPASGAPFYLGKHTTAGSGTANDQLRVTIDTYASGSTKLYSAIYKFAIFMSTNGASGCTASMQVRTTANVLNNVDTWSDIFTNVAIAGWSGWNIINKSDGVTLGSNRPTDTSNTQNRQFRFIFKQTAASASYPSSYIDNILGYGGVGWATPSNMAKYNSLYSYDANQVAYFPAWVGATAFRENGTFLSDKYAPIPTSGTFSVTNGSHSYTWNYYKVGKLVTVTGAFSSAMMQDSVVTFTALPYAAASNTPIHLMDATGTYLVDGLLSGTSIILKFGGMRSNNGAITWSNSASTIAYYAANITSVSFSYLSSS